MCESDFFLKIKTAISINDARAMTQPSYNMNLNLNFTLRVTIT